MVQRECHWESFPPCCRPLQPSVHFILPHKDLHWNFRHLSHHFAVFDLIAELPKAPWDWEIVCQQPGITIKFVRDHLEQLKWPQYFSHLSRSFSSEQIENNLDLPWDWAQFAYNESLPLSFFQRLADKPIRWFDIQRFTTDELFTLSTVSGEPMDWTFAWDRAESWTQRARLLIEQVGCFDGSEESANFAPAPPH